MAKIMVYVPDELRDQLDAAKAAGQPINLSRTAQAAFEAELAGLKRSGGTPGLVAIASRLASTRRPDSVKEKPEAQGLHSGAEWARSEATYDQLVNLDSVRSTVTPERLKVHGPTWEAPKRIYCQLNQQAFLYVSDRKVEEFWDRQCDRVGATISPEFILGWAAGALAVWKAVKELASSPELIDWFTDMQFFDFVAEGSETPKGVKVFRTLGTTKRTPEKE